MVPEEVFMDPVAETVNGNGDAIFRNRKFTIAISSMVTAIAFASVMEYAAFWLFVEELIDAALWHSFSLWILAWLAAMIGGVQTLYGAQNLIAKWSPTPPSS